MKEMRVLIGSLDEFLANGRALARDADAGRPITPDFSIMFDDPKEMAAVLTPRRIELLEHIRTGAASITHLAEQLHRDRAAVKRDIDALTRAGMVKLTEKPLPGHGKQKIVETLAERFVVMATI